MTTNRSFDRDLELWLEDQAPVKGPAGLHATAMDRAGSERQRPGWLVGLRGDGFPARPGLAGRPALAAGLLIVALGMLLVGAAIAGAFRSQPRPLGVIAYSVFESKAREGQTSFAYLVRTDGSENERFATGTCPTFSANGAVMTYRTTWAGGDLMAAAADGSSSHPLPVSVDRGYRDNGYALSPDGTRVAWFKPIEEIMFPTPDGGAEGFGSRSELWITPVTGEAGVRILPVSEIPTESYGMPVWSPDGTRIAFEGRVARPEGPVYRRAIYIVEATGGAVRELTTRPLVSGITYGLAWSPDGRLIAFLGLPDGTAVPSGDAADEARDVPPDVFVIGVDGNGERPLTSTPAFESQPRWSPDGTRLGFLQSEDGETYRLSVLPLAGTVTSGAAVLGPVSDAFAWSPDGSTLVSIDRTTIRMIDAGLTGPATTLVDVTTWPVDPKYPNAYSTDYERCPPSWQWLQP